MQKHHVHGACRICSYTPCEKLHFDKYIVTSSYCSLQQNIFYFSHLIDCLIIEFYNKIASSKIDRQVLPTKKM